MNENLDLTKILEGCPKGIAFYHTVYGTVLFNSIDLGSEYPIRFIVGKNGINSVTKSGLAILDYKGECTLFPSKDQRDWSKFERFWDKSKIEKFDANILQPFDKVLVRGRNGQTWRVELFSHVDNGLHMVVCVCCLWKQCIPYNEETKHLVGTKEGCADFYKWWGEYIWRLN